MPSLFAALAGLLVAAAPLRPKADSIILRVLTTNDFHQDSGVVHGLV